MMIKLRKVVCLIQHKIGHFADVLPSQYLGLVSIEKLKQTQQKQTCIRNKIYYNIKLNGSILEGVDRYVRK